MPTDPKELQVPGAQPEKERDDRARWDAKYEARGLVARDHARLLEEEVVAHLPLRGRALDVAGGDGRNALWLAARGLEVTICDVSPVALSHARALAEAQGLTLTTQARDLEHEPLPRGPWDLILCLHYLQRSLFAPWADALAPGGLLVFCQPTRKNLERNRHPSARFLLDEGELATLLPPALEVVSLTEDWSSEGRHEARLIARKPAP